MAHYWGLTPRSYLIQGRAGATDAAGLGPGTCGNNWTINLDRAVAGSNNGYAWACAGRRRSRRTADTLVVRRASEDALALPP